MNIWSKLFGGKEDKTIEKPVIKEENKIVTPKKTDLLSSLIESIKIIGHESNPMFRKEYALTSGIPSGDFSIWLIDKFKHKDFESIWEFVKKYYSEDENTGVGINVGEIVNNMAPEIIAKKYGM